MIKCSNCKKEIDTDELDSSMNVVICNECRDKRIINSNSEYAICPHCNAEVFIDEIYDYEEEIENEKECRECGKKFFFIIISRQSSYDIISMMLSGEEQRKKKATERKIALKNLGIMIEFIRNYGD